MQALEHSEDASPVLMVDADSVILETKLPRGLLFNRRNMNPRRLFAAIFNRVADQIREEPHKAHFIADYGGQWIAGNDCARFLNGHLKLKQRGLEDGLG